MKYKPSKMKLLAAMAATACLISACGSTAGSVPESNSTNSTQSAVSSGSVANTVTGSKSTGGSVLDTGSWKSYSFTINSLDFSEYALLQLSVPADWVYSDGSTVFFLDDIKCLEVSVFKRYDDPADPFTAMRTEMESMPGMEDTAVTPAQVDELTIPCSRNNICCRYRSVPADIDINWYPCYTYVDFDGLVVRVDYFSRMESDPDEAALLGAIIDNMSVTAQ